MSYALVRYIDCLLDFPPKKRKTRKQSYGCRREWILHNGLLCKSLVCNKTPAIKRGGLLGTHFHYLLDFPNFKALQFEVWNFQKVCLPYPLTAKCCDEWPQASFLRCLHATTFQDMWRKCMRSHVHKHITKSLLVTKQKIVYTLLFCVQLQQAFCHIIIIRWFCNSLACLPVWHRTTTGELNLFL